MAKPAKKPARKNPILDKPVDAEVTPPAPPEEQLSYLAFPLSELETWTAARVFFAARQELHQHQHQPWVAVAGDHQAKFVEGFKEKWAEIQAGGKSKLLEDWLLVGIVETMVAWGQEHG